MQSGGHMGSRKALRVRARGLLTSASICALIAPCAALAAHASAATYVFNIDAQPLSHALQMFSDQSGLQIVYYTELLPQAKVNALDGTFDAQAALDSLLRG